MFSTAQIVLSLPHRRRYAVTNEPDMTSPVTRADMTTAFAQFEAKIAQLLSAMESRLSQAIGAAARESEREFNDRLAIIDSVYRDLPKRVRDLEAKVFAPKRRATAARRKRS
jgi:hypothetical protein